MQPAPRSHPCLPPNVVQQNPSDPLMDDEKEDESKRELDEDEEGLQTAESGMQPAPKKPEVKMQGPRPTHSRASQMLKMPSPQRPH